jgi:predicted DNA-binding transcriptional regulator AlpA
VLPSHLRARALFNAFIDTSSARMDNTAALQVHIIGQPNPRAANTASPERLLLSAPEAAQALGIAVRTFHKLRRRLPAPVVIGPRCVRWRVSDLKTWLDRAQAETADRGEPPQLAAGKANRRAQRGASGGPEWDSAGGTQPPAAQSEQRRDLGHPSRP